MRVPYKMWLVIIISIISGNETMSQQELTPQQLREDFALLRTALKEAHPGLYRYNTMVHMDSVFSQTELLLDKPMTQQEFYRILIPVVTGIKCGHTKLHPDNNWMDNYYFGTERLFPLRLTFLNQKAYVIGSYSGTDDIPTGAQIISINGRSVDELAEALMKGLFSDGNNTTFKYIEMGRFFSALYANLMESPDEFLIQYMINDEIKNVAMSAISYETLTKAERQQMSDLPSKEPYSFSFTDEGIGLMKIHSFAYQGQEKYKNFLKRTFRELAGRGTSHLVIDLRDNEGGKDVRGAMLLSYLMDREFRYYDHLETTTDKKYSFAENAYLPKFYGILRMLLTRTDSGTILWKHSKNLKMQKPRKEYFTGKVYILINGASFSVTSEFAALMHYLKRATFIGEETGGGFYGNNSGTFVIAKLPNSRINLGIPMLAYYVAVKDYAYHNRGVIPDYQVQPSITDLLMKNDPVMEFTLQLISN